MTLPPVSPRLFALVDDENEDANDPSRVVGYGLTLPDGSAVSVSWPLGCGVAYCSSESAEDNAALRGADLVWMTAQEPS